MKGKELCNIDEVLSEDELSGKPKRTMDPEKGKIKGP